MRIGLPGEDWIKDYDNDMGVLAVRETQEGENGKEERNG